MQAALKKSDDEHGELATDKIANDFLDLFLGKRDGHLTEYLYEGQNDFFDRVTKDQECYYITNSDIELVEMYGSKIHDLVGDNLNFIEIGPGYKYTVENKTVPLIKNFQHILSYRAIDLYLHLSQEATACVESLCSNVSQVTPLEGDLMKPYQFAMPKEKTCMLFWGSTFSNFLDKDIDKAMSNISQILKDGDFFICTLDCCQNQEMIVNAYSSQFAQKGTKNIFHFLQKSLKIKNFDFNDFTFLCSWNPDTCQAELFLLSTKNQSFELKGHTINVKKDQLYKLIRSRKFSTDWSKSMFNSHGFKVLESFAHPVSNVTVFLTQKTTA